MGKLALGPPQTISGQIQKEMKLTVGSCRRKRRGWRTWAGNLPFCLSFVQLQYFIVEFFLGQEEVMISR
jgi:hypothetical protein